MFRKLRGDVAFKNVVLVTTMWDCVSPDDGEDRESRLSNRHFKPVLDLGAQMARHHNTAQSAREIIRKIVMNSPVVLQIQRELVNEHKDIVHTTAGGALIREANDQMRRCQDDLKGIEKDTEQALWEGDVETMRELEELRRETQEKIEGIKKDSERGRMALNYAAEKKRVEEKMKEMEQEAKKRGE